METLEAKAAEEITGEFEVVTVRTLSGEYQHTVFLNGRVETSKAEIEDAERKNVQKYEDEMKLKLTEYSDMTLENVRTFVLKKNYTERAVEFTYPTYSPKDEQNKPHSTSIVLA